MTAPKAAGDKPAAPAEPPAAEPAPAEPPAAEPAPAEPPAAEPAPAEPPAAEPAGLGPTVSSAPDPDALAKAAKKRAKKKAKKKAAKAAATREHDHDAPPLWLDQVEGDGPTRRAFRSCQVAGCTVRVELGKVKA